MSQAGGPSTLIGASDYVGTRPIVTDGTRVFWSDPWMVLRVLVGGGSLGTVASHSSPVLGVDGTFVYYVDGLVIRRVRSAGGAAPEAHGSSGSIA
jgi:hypothetical protein